MLSKSTLKYIKSLRQAKYRQKYHKIVVEGSKSVIDVLNGQLLEIDAIYALGDWISAHEVHLQKCTAEIQPVADHELTGLSSLSTTQSVLAVCEMPAQQVDLKKVANSLCLYLDGIRDPGNVGTIFRIADWFGLGQIFLSADTADPFNPKVIQASMGSLFRVPWAEAQFDEILIQTGLTPFVTTLDGENIYTADLPDAGIIVLGNESVGVRHQSLSGAARQLMIPGDRALGAESLNVAIAAGIICSEFRRRPAAVS
jgi:TrmH family RNA methyltransferase